MIRDRDTYRYDERPTYKKPLEVFSGRELRRKRRKERRKKLTKF